MEIIAQAVVGVSKFLHPDYVSSTGIYYEKDLKIDLFDGRFSTGEMILTVYSIAGIIIIGLLIAYLISVRRNRLY